MTARQLPEPLAQGDLSRTPFAHVLLYVQKHALSGTLVVWLASGEERPSQDRILFDHGVPIAGRLLEPASRLERGMLPLFARTSGPYAFYENLDLVGSGEGARTGEVQVLPLIAASLRGSSRDDVVAHVVEGFGASKLRLELGVDLDALGLLPEERAFIELLRAEPMSVARLAEISPLPPKMAQRIVYLLALTKSVSVWEGELEAPRKREEPPRPERAPAPARESAPATNERESPPPPPPSSLSGEHRALWLEIVARVAAIEDENYFEMLGVPRDAPTTAIQKAYFGLVKKWHPDRIPKELEALSPHIERVFRYLTRAHETLSDENERGPYLATVQDGGGTPAAERKLAAIVQAAMDFRKVEVLLRRRELDEALELVDRILEVADDDPDYHAARGWILFQKHPNDPALRAAALASVERALGLGEKHDKAHYYKGMMLQRAGRAREAAECFRRAAEINPKNIEAVRMVRLAGMRGEDDGGPSPDDASGGKRDSLFGKLFGGKKK